MNHNLWFIQIDIIPFKLLLKTECSVSKCPYADSISPLIGRDQQIYDSFSYVQSFGYDSLANL